MSVYDEGYVESRREESDLYAVVELSLREVADALEEEEDE